MRVGVRPARTSDVPAIHALVSRHAGAGLLLEKSLVALYEDVREFQVAEVDGAFAGCGALHVLWADLAEVRTLVVAPEHRGAGVGAALLAQLTADAAAVGVKRLFCLTFEVGFFTRHGFAPIDGVPVPPEVFAELLESYDDGVAEFLDLAEVKPNTLGNTRMLLELGAAI